MVPAGRIEPTAVVENTYLIDLTKRCKRQNRQKSKIRIRRGYAEDCSGTNLFLSKEILMVVRVTKSPQAVLISTKQPGSVLRNSQWTKGFGY
jgi:hypothetical protein